MSQEPPKPNPCDITIFETEDGRTRVEVRFERENVWLTQKLMADLYECSTDNISLHLANIYADRELDPAATTEESSVVQTEGNREVRRPVTLYSLEAIIAVGFRVQSPRATQFRTWATNRLKDYILKGFAIDSTRFKHGCRFDRRFFEELLEEVREIRASERTQDLQKRRGLRMGSLPMKTKTGIPQAFSGNTRRPSILSPAKTVKPPAPLCQSQKNDRPGYSCERTPWVLVTGAGPLNHGPASVLGRVPFDAMQTTFRNRRPQARMLAAPNRSNPKPDANDHPANRLECIRTRKSPSADEEIGHRAACIGRLINIADLTGRSLKWDPVKKSSLPATRRTGCARGRCVRRGRCDVASSTLGDSDYEQ